MSESQYHLRRLPIEQVGTMPMLIDEEGGSNGAILEFGDTKWGLRWIANDEPKILFLDEFDLVIAGVSESVGAATVRSGTIKLRIGLHNPFYYFKKLERGFLVVSETTVTAINGHNCSIIKFDWVPDIITDTKVVGNKILVETLNGKYEIIFG